MGSSPDGTVVRPSGIVSIGVDLGKQHDPSAIAVSEVLDVTIPPLGDWTLDRASVQRNGGVATGHDWRHTPEQRYVTYHNRFLTRIPLGTSYTDIAELLTEAMNNAMLQPSVKSILLWIDATGVGLPVVEMVMQSIKKSQVGGRQQRIYVAPTMFTSGQKFTMTDGVAYMGKQYLVSNLVQVMQTDRLKVDESAEGKALRAELGVYELRVNENANVQFGAFKAGTHDDLVTALGLSVLYDRNRTLDVPVSQIIRR
jgi:hypothetical protein